MYIKVSIVKHVSYGSIGWDCPIWTIYNIYSSYIGALHMLKLQIKNINCW